MAPAMSPVSSVRGAAAGDSSPANGGKAKGDVRFRTQFRKTELCAFHNKGWCSKGERCEFAHGEEELQRAPDLTKTSLCKKWLRHACSLQSDQCGFAHGARELRVTSAYAHEASSSPKRTKSKRERPAQQPEAAPDADDDDLALPIVPSLSAASSSAPTRTLPEAERPQLTLPAAALVMSEQLLGSQPDATTPVPEGLYASCSYSPCAAPYDFCGNSPTHLSPMVMMPFCFPVPEKPAVFQSAPPAVHAAVPAEPAPNRACLDFVAGIAANAAAGSGQDLAFVLRQAMPDCYED